MVRLRLQPSCFARNLQCRDSRVRRRLPSDISINELTPPWCCSGLRPSTIRQARLWTQVPWVSGLRVAEDGCSVIPLGMRG